MQNDLYPASAEAGLECSETGVAWAAIIGGALTAIGFTLILSPLGSAFGMASPWHHDPEPGKALTMASAIWLIVVQWISSGLGGYLTGRLRKKWPGAHTHEVFFRDTAHGFLSWALATFVGALVLASIASHIGAAHMPPNAHEAANAYYTDSLFRTEQANATVSAEDRQESSRIIAMGLMHGGEIPGNDRNYLVQLIAARTGLSPADADKRVETVVMREKASVETAEKNMAKASLFLTLALLVGAFIASAAATLGGRDRDVHYATGKFTV